MKKLNNFGVFLALCVLLSAVITPIPLNSAVPDAPLVATIAGRSIHSTAIGVIHLGYITGNLSGQTQFACDNLRGKGNDFYNVGWLVYVPTGATNITAGARGDVTDYISSSGTFTVDAIGANWATGDQVLLVFGNVGRDLEFGGSLPLIGKVSACTNTSSNSSAITVPEFAGLSTTLFSASESNVASSRYLLRVMAVDDAVDTLMIGRFGFITNLTDAGVLTVKPAITDDAGVQVLDAGDIIQIEEIASEFTTGEYFHGFAASGGSGTVIFTGLIGMGQAAIVKGSTIKCINDADASTNDDKVSMVTDFDSDEGKVTFLPTFTPAVQDEFVIKWDPAAEMITGILGLPAAPTPASYAANVSIADIIAMNQDLAYTIRDSLQSSTQIRLQSRTFYVQPADADTTAFAVVTDSTIVIVRIEAIITQTGTDAQNLQLVCDSGGGGVHTSFGADLDFDTPAVGARVYWDLSNPGNAPVSVGAGVVHFASDIFEEAAEVPAGSELGFEMSESPSTNSWFNLTIWYYTDGGILTTP